MVRPCVASGFAELAVSGLASMYPAFDWSFCSGPSWISARMRSRYRTGLDRAIWVTSVRMRREGRTSISFHPLADLGWKLLIGLRHRLLLISYSSFVRAKGRSFVPARRASIASRAGAVKAGRRAWLAAGSGVARLRLDRAEHGARTQASRTPASSVLVSSKARPLASTAQAMRASLLASAIASTLWCNRLLAASIQDLSP
jgi:hypothetical protein